MKKSPGFCATATLALLGPMSAHAASDYKLVAPTECQPLGPGTTLEELTINSFGVYNPGDTNETVLCAIPGDSETAWSSTIGTVFVIVYFRAGAVSGKVSCSGYTGSTVNSAMPTFVTSSNPGFMSAGVRSSFTLPLADVSGGVYSVAPPANLVCTLTPKAALGSLYLQEAASTSTP